MHKSIKFEFFNRKRPKISELNFSYECYLVFLYKIEKLEVRKFCERWKNVPLKGKNTYVCYSNSDYKLIINLKKSSDKKSSDKNYILNIN